MKKIVLALMLCLSMTNIVNAQCAWVLWEQDIAYTLLPLPKDSEWKLIMAFPKFEQCLSSQKQYFEAEKLRWEEQQSYYRKFSHQKLELISNAGQGVSSLILRWWEIRDGEEKISGTREEIFKCLPDTVDPRK